jgi:hypothetical protein
MTRTSAWWVFDSPQSLVLPFLQQAKQFGLDLGRQVADFIEQQRTAGGRAHLAVPIPCRAGKRAPDMAEEFTLQQVPRETRATDGDQSMPGTVAAPMDFAGQHALAGAALAQEQDGGVGRGHLAGQFEGLPGARIAGRENDRGFRRIGGGARPTVLSMTVLPGSCLSCDQPNLAPSFKSVPGLVNRAHRRNGSRTEPERD